MSGVEQPRPFSWADAEPHIVKHGWSAGEVGAQAAGPGDGMSIQACRKRAALWKVRGFTVWEADRLATALGMYPSEIWGDVWWAQPAVDVEQLFRTLRSRARKARTADRSRRRVRARIVDGYTAVERAQARGPHQCAPDGCCARLRAADDMLTEAA